MKNKKKNPTKKKKKNKFTKKKEWINTTSQGKRTNYKAFSLSFFFLFKTVNNTN